MKKAKQMKKVKMKHKFMDNSILLALLGYLTVLLILSLFGVKINVFFKIGYLIQAILYWGYMRVYIEFFKLLMQRNLRIFNKVGI